MTATHEDIHGNYTTLHEKDLTNFGEKIHFEVLELEENPYPNDQIELISVKSDKEVYLPNEEGEITIEIKSDYELNGLSAIFHDTDYRDGFFSQVFVTDNVSKNNNGNYIIKAKFRTPYFFS